MTQVSNRLGSPRKPRYSSSRWCLHHGDVSKVLPTLSGQLYDGVLTDAPYGLKFMGLKWDHGVPPIAVWQKLLAVCKPGAFLIAFGSPRTGHRLTSNIEDAGWEIRDAIAWLFGSGMPKGQNVGKGLAKLNVQPIEVEKWTGYGTGLKPAWEPIVVAMKPRQGSFARNALKYGVGGLNVDECRVGTDSGTKRSHQVDYPRLADGAQDRAKWPRTGHKIESLGAGRYPANLILGELAAEEVDRQSGLSRSRFCAGGVQRKSNVGNGITLSPFRSRPNGVEGYDDEGGASRYFYVAKASKNERRGNKHPTVKPLSLCEHIARLILPPEREEPRRLLVPYSGSGSEMLGALSAGWDHVTGIELDENWVSVARRRLEELESAQAVPHRGC